MVLRAIVSTIVFYVLAGAALFALAGRLAVPAFWAWLAFMLASSLVFIPALDRACPGLLAERLHPGPGDRDRFGVAIGVGQMLATFAIAGLDARAHAVPLVPVPVIAVAGAVVAAGFWIVAWAMMANPFFSSAVRLQADRAQVVVDRGPYALVRHPGYTGGLLFMCSTGLALGSWWALLPVPVAVIWYLRRTLLEDAMLRRELVGYDAYAARVRFRLLPGVW